jgi:DNA-binding NarL/FixJ family response regulator
MLLCALLIEDSQAFRDGLIPALHDMAAVEVIAVAETAHEAVAALGALSDRWQLAVVDLVLREGSGLDVLRAMERRLAHQRVVVLTNYATPEMRERAQRTVLTSCSTNSRRWMHSSNGAPSFTARRGLAVKRQEVVS